MNPHFLTLSIYLFPFFTLALILLTWRIWWAPNNAADGTWDLTRRLKVKCLLKCPLNLILVTWRIWWAPNNASRWQMVFNSAFKELKCLLKCPLTLTVLKWRIWWASFNASRWHLTRRLKGRNLLYSSPILCRFPLQFVSLNAVHISPHNYVTQNLSGTKFNKQNSPY